MAGIGRTPRFEDPRIAGRSLDRRLAIVTPERFNHTGILPPAREYEGRIVYVGGTTKRLYMSDGSNWRQVTVV